MIKKKVCLLGSFGVGKTSLIRKYVKNIFSDEYLTTIGVKVEKKTLSVEDNNITLIIWDLEGTDDFNSLSENYLVGMAAYFLVVDGTRAETLKTAKKLKSQLNDKYPSAPSIMLINKLDLKKQWTINELDFKELEKDGIKIIKTSAKTGMGVEESFITIAKQCILNEKKV